MPNIIIRRAAIKDFLEIAELDRESWGDEEINRYIPDGEHAWRLWVEYGLVFCCHKHSEIIGVALAFPTISNLFVVHKIFVRQSERGNSYGTKLLMELVKEMDKMKVDSFLTVDPSNIAAIAVYKKIGYQRLQLYNGFYRKNEDRLIVQRSYQRDT